MKVENEIDERRIKVSRKINLPILAEFLAVLRIEDRDLRIVAFNEFHKNLNEECDKVLCKEKKRCLRPLLITKRSAWRREHYLRKVWV